VREKTEAIDILHVKIARGMKKLLIFNGFCLRDMSRNMKNVYKVITLPNKKICWQIICHSLPFKEFFSNGILHGSQAVAYKKNWSSKASTFLKKSYFLTLALDTGQNVFEKNFTIFWVPTIRQLLVGVGFQTSNFLFVHSTLMYNVHSWK